MGARRTIQKRSEQNSQKTAESTTERVWLPLLMKKSSPPYRQTYVVMMVIWVLVGIGAGCFFGISVAASWFVSGLFIPKIEMKPKVNVSWNDEQH